MRTFQTTWTVLNSILTIFRPSSVEYASKLLGSNASSYLSPSSMSDTENNNNHDKLDSEHQQNQRSVSPLRLGRKRPASADLDHNDHIIEDDHLNHHHRGNNDQNLHFKARHPSSEAYNMSEVADQRFDFRVNEHSRSDSPIKEESLSLKDISILRNPEESIKREKH